MKTPKESAEVGVIVGRFQVPRLHDEHKALIQRVSNTHPRTLIVLGLAPDSCKCTYNNPLDFAARKMMIEAEFKDVEVFYIRDVGHNEKWSKELDRIIASQIGPNQNVVLYGGRDSFLNQYCGKYPTEELVPNKILSGKEVRKNVGLKSKGTVEFREGVIWAVENQWPGALPTVDAAIIDPNTQKILLGKKPNRDQYQFIGGFATPESPNYESDAEREVREETGLDCVNFRYLGSAKIDDWRYRNERNKIKTVFFTCELYSGIAKADDDIAEVKWFDLEELTEETFIPEHRVLFRMLREKIIDPQLKVGTIQ